MNKKMLSGLMAFIMSAGMTAVAPVYATATTTQKYEAELATLHNVALGDNKYPGYSGTGYVAGMDASDAYIEFTVTVATAGRYNLGINYCAPYGYKQETVTVNGGQSFNAIFESSTSFAEINAGTVKLNAGENKIRISRCWGWTLFDYITVAPAGKLEVNTNIAPTLINPNATAETHKLMNYLTSIYGKHILSGQFAYTTKYTEIDTIYKQTGKYPAIIGLDFSDYSPSRVALGCNPGQDTEKAIEYWKQGGISTFCWHWASPLGGSTDADKKWGSFYTKNTTYDLSKAMSDHTSAEYTTLIRDIDAIAVQLKKLQAAKVPILWRPLHEASGGWFWWGAYGADNYKTLWKLMYDRLTNYHGINNLIWVWNAQDASWYPGDEYVDIIGEDIYANKQDYDSQYNGFVKAMNYTTADKLITMSENGVLMDPDLLVGDGVPWLWNCTWGGEFVVPWVGSTDYTENYTSLAMLKKYYSHDYVLTRDELPTSLFDSSVINPVSVAITSPTAGQVFDCSTAYTPITLNANVTTSASNYTVEYFVNDQSVGKGASVQWTPSGQTTNADGLVTYKVVAKVTTADGVTASSPVSFTVKLPVKKAMTAAFTTPITSVVDATNGATVPLSVTVANVDDYTVEYFVDGKSIGTSKTVNWNISGSTFNADGLVSYEVSAVVTGSDGQKVTIKQTVTAKLPVKKAMTVALTSPTEGQVFDCTAAGAVIPLTATVANSDSYTIEYFVDGKSVGTGSTGSFVPTDKVTTAGGTKTYSVVAVATGTDGQKATSATVTMTVKLPVVQQNVSVAQTNGAASGNTITVNTTMTNNGSTMDLTQVELRYYFTEEGTATQSVWCDNVALQLNNAPWYVSVTAGTKANIVSLGNNQYYLSVKFTETTPLTQTGKLVFQARIAKADWSNYDQSNDLSYNKGIAVLYGGALIAGVQP